MGLYSMYTMKLALIWNSKRSQKLLLIKMYNNYSYLRLNVNLTKGTSMRLLTLQVM